MRRADPVREVVAALALLDAVEAELRKGASANIGRAGSELALAHQRLAEALAHLARL